MNETNLNPLAATIYGPRLENWNEFTEPLQQAINAQLPSRKNFYNQVNVLLICFEEDDMDGLIELTDFRFFLEREFHYSCETWVIEPLAREAAISIRILQWVTNNDRTPNCLGIIYYIGHGSSNTQEKSIWRASADAKTSINWSRVESNLEQSESDILCILDTCFAATAGIAGNTELLAATGIGEIARGPGERSFTSRLMAAMQDFQAPFNVAMLHGRLCDRRFRISGGQTPIHIQRADRPRESIFLVRLTPGVQLGLTQPIPPEIRGAREPRVLIKFSLNADAGLPDIQQWIDYLTQGLPSFIEGGDISIEGGFEASSTVVLLAVPIAVWGCLPPNPALAFVAFVDSSNLLFHLPRNF